MNRAGLDMIEADTFEQVRGQPVSLLVAEEYREAFQAVNEKVFRGESGQLEFEIVGLKGTRRWLNTHAVPLRNQKDEITAALGITRDITERKRAEKAMQESENKFRTLAEESPNMIFINKGGHIVYANKRCEEVMGYTKEEFYSEDFDPMELIALESRDLVKENLGKQMSGEELQPYEYKILTKNGKEITAIHATRMIDFEGDKAILGIVTDITERIWTEEALKVRSRQQEVVAVLGQHALAGIDLEELLSETTTLVAQTLDVEYCKVLELLPDGKTLLLRTGFGWKEGIAGNATVGTDTNSQAGYTLLSSEPVIVKDLRTEKRFSGPQLLQDHGVISGMSVLIGDIKRPFGVLGAHTTRQRTFTREAIHFLQSVSNILAEAIERKQAEEELREHREHLEDLVEERTVELQEANAELESFSYSVSHDLRAPLRAMQGFSEVLLEDYADCFDLRGQDYARRIIDAAQSMDTLIHDLLSYSKITRIELQLTPVSIEGVIRETLKQLEAVISESGAEVRVSGPMPEILSHHATMVQVVANLLSNSIKFVADGVRPQVHIRAEERGKRVRLWVEDNGIGISPEHYGRIFRLFERLHGIEAYPGTGIGLAVVQKAVERMRGLVGVESEEEKGSRFWIELIKYRKTEEAKDGD